MMESDCKAEEITVIMMGRYRAGENMGIGIVLPRLPGDAARELVSATSHNHRPDFLRHSTFKIGVVFTISASALHTDTHSNFGFGLMFVKDRTMQGRNAIRSVIT